MTTRIAIVGAGSMAREHVRAFRDVPGVEVTGIHSRTRSKAEALAAEFGIGQVCDSVEALYAATHADLVVVTVYETSMRSVAIACCRHPWHLLLEKPPGMNPQETADILQASRQHSRRAMVGLNRRFLTSTRAALADVATRDEPRFIHVQDQQSLDVARSIGHSPEVVAQWMYANSIHLVDYLLAFGRGAISQVRPIAHWNPAQPGVVLAHVQFESGDSGLYEGIWNGPGPWAVTVNTPSKRWEMRPLEKAQFQLAGERRQQAVEPDAVDTQYKPGFFLQAQHVVAAVRGEPSDAPSLEEALQCMQLVQQVFSPAGFAAQRVAA